MINLFDNINVEIPKRFMSSIWNQCELKRKAKVNVGFNYENQNIEIIMYSTSARIHKNISWTNELYAFLENECLKYAKETVHGLHQVKEVGNLSVNEDHLVTAK